MICTDRKIEQTEINIVVHEMHCQIIIFMRVARYHDCLY